MGLMNQLLFTASNQIKGAIGEISVAGELAQLPTDQYLTINNVMLHTKTGTTQIDHVIVSVYGIFVIETKNHTGTIIGNEFDTNWIKRTKSGRYSFYNPIKQNQGHIKNLASLLKIPETAFIPLVVFSDSCVLQISTVHRVINAHYLLPTIRYYKEVKFTFSQVTEFANSIREINDTHLLPKVEHAFKVKQISNQSRKKITYGICPKCGGKLILRGGKHGDFVGCSNYPTCRYTANI